ncbi:MAG: hypothetical protein QMD09_09570 [Desulfatibacillaceae bacterium]|nr:hypothetical protein [Desulfatibacillaceae bacterium]
MRKLIVLVAAAMLFLPMSAMAGMTAFMDMEQVSDFELAETTGQTGLTIDLTVASSSFTWVSWGDDDGYAPLTTIGGVLYIVPITPLALDLNVTVDVCTSLGVNYLVLEVTGLTFSNAIALGLGDGAAGVGNAVDAGAIALGPTADKLGILTIDATLDSVLVLISAH